jgi:hypothetical protein
MNFLPSRKQRRKGREIRRADATAVGLLPLVVETMLTT